MLTLDHLACAREGRVLFRGIALSLPPGGSLTITGANGSGKSTLLAGLAGLFPFHEGCLRWRDEAVNPAGEFRSAVSYLGHALAVKDTLTPREDLTFWARLYGGEERVEAALHFWHLTPFATMHCHTLSAGWRRRVALARLLLSNAPVWLLDEPAANLDAEGKTLLQGLIETRLMRGGIVIATAPEMPGVPDAQTLRLAEYRP